MHNPKFFTIRYTRRYTFEEYVQYRSTCLKSGTTPLLISELTMTRETIAMSDAHDSTAIRESAGFLGIESIKEKKNFISEEMIERMWDEIKKKLENEETKEVTIDSINKILKETLKETISKATEENE